MVWVLPNHGFTIVIKAMGPTKESFMFMSPIDVSISNVVDWEGSLIMWIVSLPLEFALRLVLPLSRRKKSRVMMTTLTPWRRRRN